MYKQIMIYKLNWIDRPTQIGLIYIQNVLRQHPLTIATNYTFVFFFLHPFFINSPREFFNLCFFFIFGYALQSQGLPVNKFVRKHIQNKHNFVVGAESFDENKKKKITWLCQLHFFLKWYALIIGRNIDEYLLGRWGDGWAVCSKKNSKMSFFYYIATKP